MKNTVPEYRVTLKKKHSMVLKKAELQLRSFLVKLYFGLSKALPFNTKKYSKWKVWIKKAKIELSFTESANAPRTRRQAQKELSGTRPAVRIYSGSYAWAPRP